MALFLNRSSKSSDEEGAPESEPGESEGGARGYFDEYTAALEEGDQDGAYDALCGMIDARKGS